MYCKGDHIMCYHGESHQEELLSLLNKSTFGTCNTPWLAYISIQERWWMPFLELKWPNDHEGQGQWPPFSITAERIPRCIFGANLVIPAQIHYQLLHGEAKFPRILSQNGQNDLEGQSQWPPFSRLAESIPWYMFGANLVILAHICDDLSRGQAKFPRILSQNAQNDLKGQSQWPPFSIPSEGIPWCMFGANLVIPTQICDELSCRQSLRTDRWTCGRMERRIPIWPERRRVKKHSHGNNISGNFN